MLVSGLEVTPNYVNTVNEMIFCLNSLSWSMVLCIFIGIPHNDCASRHFLDAANAELNFPALSVGCFCFHPLIDNFLVGKLVLSAK